MGSWFLCCGQFSRSDAFNLDDFILATVWFSFWTFKSSTQLVRMELLIRTDDRLSEHQLWMKRNAAFADRW